MTDSGYTERPEGDMFTPEPGQLNAYYAAGNWVPLGVNYRDEASQAVPSDEFAALASATSDTQRFYDGQLTALQGWFEAEREKGAGIVATHALETYQRRLQEIAEARDLAFGRAENAATRLTESQDAGLSARPANVLPYDVPECIAADSETRQPVLAFASTLGDGAAKVGIDTTPDITVTDLNVEPEQTRVPRHWPVRMLARAAFTGYVVASILSNLKNFGDNLLTTGQIDQRIVDRITALTQSDRDAATEAEQLRVQEYDYLRNLYDVQRNDAADEFEQERKAILAYYDDKVERTKRELAAQATAFGSDESLLTQYREQAALLLSEATANATDFNSRYDRFRTSYDDGHLHEVALSHAEARAAARLDALLYTPKPLQQRLANRILRAVRG